MLFSEASMYLYNTRFRVISLAFGIMKIGTLIDSFVSQEGLGNLPSTIHQGSL